MTRHVDQNWKLLQQTTFTKWVNNALRGHLKTAKTQVEDLQKDLRDGLVLVELIESIGAPRKVGRHNKNPTIKPQMLENLGAVFRFLEREQIKVVNIGKLQRDVASSVSLYELAVWSGCVKVLLSLA